MKDFKKEFLNLASYIRKELQKSHENSVIQTVNGIELYVNKEATYFTARIKNNEISIYIVSDSKNDITIKNISSDREYILIMDAFEDLYEKIYKKNNKEAIEYEKYVDSLFEKFLKRRKITQVKKYLELSKNEEKVYI